MHTIVFSGSSHMSPVQRPSQGPVPGPIRTARTSARTPTGLCAVVALFGMLAPSLASATPLLGAAQNFAVLAHETVTNAHSGGNVATQVYGDVGVSPGMAVTGFNPDGTVTGGAIRVNDPLTQQALADAAVAYNVLAGASAPPLYNLTGQDLGTLGYALTPGIYHFDTGAQLTGLLTLDFQGNPNASFVFQIGSALTTAGNSVVNVLNGGALSEVYWQVGSSATLGVGSSFAGNVLAAASVSLNPGAQILGGRAIALAGAVTLSDNRVSDNSSAENFGGAHLDFNSYGYSGGAVSPVPEPGSTLLFGAGLSVLAWVKKRSHKQA